MATRLIVKEFFETTKSCEAQLKTYLEEHNVKETDIITLSYAATNNEKSTVATGVAGILLVHIETYES